MLSVAFTLAFHGFLRVSAFTMPLHIGFNPRLYPKYLHRRYFTFLIPRSKTHQLHKVHTTQVSRTTPVSICLVKQMRAYMYMRTIRWTSGPLFTLSDGRPLTRHRCLHYLRRSLEHVGHRPEDYNTHSFRIGAASTAAHEGQASPPYSTFVGEEAVQSRPIFAPYRYRQLMHLHLVILYTCTTSFIPSLNHLYIHSCQSS